MFVLLAIAATAQKKIIDTTAFTNWRKLDQYGISDNGSYIWYTSKLDDKTDLFLQSTSSSFKRKFPGSKSAVFSPDSKSLIFKNKNDDLVIFNILEKRSVIIPQVIDFSSLYVEKKAFLVYRIKAKLSVRNLQTGEEKVFDEPQNFVLNTRNSAILLYKTNGVLEYITLPDLKSKVILQVNGIGNLTFDESGERMAFTKTTGSETEVLFWEPNLDSIKSLVSNSKADIQPNYSVGDQDLRFSLDGQRLFFKLKRLRTDPVKGNDLLVNTLTLYHYRDPFLKGEFNYISQKEFYTASCLISNGKVSQIEDTGNGLVPLGSANPNTPDNNHIILIQNMVNAKNRLWDRTQQPIYKLLDLNTGVRKTFVPSSHDLGHFTPILSPSEKFIVWLDVFTGDFFSYEISTGRLCNLTKEIKLSSDIVFEGGISSPTQKFFSEIIFIEGKEDILFRDKFDVWRSSLSGIENPECLTAGYGRKNNIEFDLYPLGSSLASHCIKFDKKKGLNLRFLDHRGNSNGFARINVQNPKGLEILSNDPCLYSWNLVDGTAEVKKARNALMFVLTRQTSSSAPNLVISKDLKTFSPITYIHPEKAYNWLTSELIRWPMYSGEIGTGILYKPENFDPTKKYPVIFHYYQKRSDELHKFWEVEPSSGSSRGNSINIPEYVSAGYLIFIPDIINDKAGEIGRTTVNAVESAAKYLIKSFSFIDGSRLGLQGHSFGGYETNLLVANSNLFAAANASASVTNIVSQHGSRVFNDGEMFTETGQTNMGFGVTPWNSPQAYIENSPIFHADKITTPLLLNVGSGDNIVSSTQGFELFLALRRLRKPSWLLEYGGYGAGGHNLGDGQAKDFAIRQRQFFDHYLMNKPAPIWMTKGISENEQNLKSGFTLDITGEQP